MRVVQNIQMQIGEVDVSKIKFDLQSRDDIPKILRGLQHLYIDLALRTQLFALLEEHIAPKVDKRNGRPGMTLWRIFVCGVVRLDLNADYDRLHELVNHHDTLREMLGHGGFDDYQYHYQTLKDNVSLFTPELLGKINQMVVDAGHVLLKKKESEALHGRCDSFVVETKVHFPTDINLLFDAMRKIITLTGRWCELKAISDWRQHQHNVRHLKRLMRRAQNTRRSKAKSEEQKHKNEALTQDAYQVYLDAAERYLSKAQATLTQLEAIGADEYDVLRKLQIEGFMKHAIRQIDQTRRRVISGEVIPHADKVFSIFEPHTEWISKGKAGVPVELGLKVCILEDQYQFILHHEVMQQKTDDQVAVSMVAQAKKRFPGLSACSFDKGFHSPGNQDALKEHLDLVALPRKGKLSQSAQAAEQTPAFIKARRAHSAVESAINALEVHGLDMCPDHGIDGFRRYVAFAVVARNIHRIGAILWQQEQKRKKRKKKCSNRAPPAKRAA
ncbi:MAG: ISNCY family transposase [Candidatus Nitrotoga sp.]